MNKRGIQQFAVQKRRPKEKQQFGSFNATELYCPKCGRSMPVRERLLLVLPEGDKYEYLCAYCGTSVGDKIVRGERQPMVII
ncbi:MAG: cytoplasmic protein [Desulfomonile tiedjei]|uniref:Cytoplasmic protein n=1 Tax=Desulfomonile tiedjei TaxID=2358 RepID=A0A9D6Z681_9BACT|nr:cytoplasmic protein [Desulfomonile tiedjei]